MKTSANGKGKKPAIIYTRVSTDEQAQRGYSLRDQKQRLEQFCQINGYTIVAHFQDDISAKTFRRPAFKDLLNFVKDNRKGVSFLLFVKWDRFSRNAEAAYSMIRHFTDLGIEVNAVEQPVDTSIPENKLMLAFYLAAPEVENERRSINTKMGMRRAMREGRVVSCPPKGYTNIRDTNGKPLMHPNEDAPFVQEAFKEFALGIYSQNELLCRIRSKGFRCSKNQFGLMLRNVLYSGRIFIPAWRDEPETVVEGLHEPLVDLDTFEQVQAALKGSESKRRGKPTRRNERLPLRGYLRCKECGGNLTGSAAKGNGGTYFYYHCQRGCPERFSAEAANKAFERELDHLVIAPEVAQLYLNMMEDIFKEQEGDREREVENVRREIGKMDDRLFRVDEKFVEGALEPDSYKRMKTRYAEEKRKLEERERILSASESNFIRYARYGLSLLSDLPRYFREGEVAVQQKLIGLIFPSKLIFDGGSYRTPTVNEAVALLAGKKTDYAVNKNGLTVSEDDQSYLAPFLAAKPVNRAVIRRRRYSRPTLCKEPSAYERPNFRPRRVAS